MSNAEHLIENAMFAIKKDSDENTDVYVKNFYEDKRNIEMAQEVGIKLNDVYSMAQYVWFDWLKDPSTIDELYAKLHS